MSAEVYKVLHIVGVMLVFLGLGGAIVRSAGGGEKCRKVVGITLGLGLLFVLVGGFGLIAKLKLGWPIWALVKIGIWVIIGGLLAVINRKPSAGLAIWITVIVLGAVAAYLGHTWGGTIRPLF